jgi:hypothetical protein
MCTLSGANMSKASLRRLLSKLTALALSTSTVGPAAAEPARAAPGLDAPDSGDAGDPGGDEVDDADFDASVPIDRGHLDVHDAAAVLGRKLALAMGPAGLTGAPRGTGRAPPGLRPLSATHLAASWSLAADPLRRLAVAHALEWVFPLVGDALVIDHLSRDPDPAVRVAAARAAWARRHTGGDLGVLARLSHDPDPAVRAVAGSARA